MDFNGKKEFRPMSKKYHFMFDCMCTQTHEKHNITWCHLMAGRCSSAIFHKTDGLDGYLHFEQIGFLYRRRRRRRRRSLKFYCGFWFWLFLDIKKHSNLLSMGRLKAHPTLTDDELSIPAVSPLIQICYSGLSCMLAQCVDLGFWL